MSTAAGPHEPPGEETAHRELHDHAQEESEQRAKSATDGRRDHLPRNQLASDGTEKRPQQNSKRHEEKPRDGG